MKEDASTDWLCVVLVVAGLVEGKPALLNWVFDGLVEDVELDGNTNALDELVNATVRDIPVLEEAAVVVGLLEFKEVRMLGVL